MQIPHKVEIKPGVFYTVAYVDKFDDPTQLGECCGPREKVGTRTIFLLKSMQKKQMEDIFMHELLHAIEFEYKIQIPHKMIYDLQGPLAYVLGMNPVTTLISTAAAARKRKKRRRG